MKRVVRCNQAISGSTVPVFAADDDFTADEFLADDGGMGVMTDPVPFGEEPASSSSSDTGDIGDKLDDLSDGVDELQDQLDDVEPDDVAIDLENNIDGCLVAECDGCHGVFISAMRQSDQRVDHISGICPLCSKETDQMLKWVIQKLKNEA